MLLYFLFLFILSIPFLLYTPIYPKKYKYLRTSSLSEFKKEKDNTKNRFSPNKVIKNPDIIIIGSGISGLTIAGLLSRLNWKVLVLEQHDTAGGCTHEYKDKGFTFDTGIHYIGNVEKQDKILDLFTKKKIKWKKMGENNNYIYDCIIIGNKKYEIRSGKENLLQDLCEWFPSERKNIISFFTYVDKITSKNLYFVLKIIKPQWLANIIDKLFNREFYNCVNKSAYEVISSFTKNKDLIDLLCGMSFDGGPPSKKQSSFLNLSIIKHFEEGSYYPIGGTGTIAKNIIHYIESKGNQVLVNAPVTNIIVKNNKTRGVQLGDKKNTILYCSNVVSTIGLYNTYKKILPKEYSNDIDYVFENVTSNVTYNMMYLGINKSREEFNFKDCNYWISPDSNSNDKIEEFEKNQDSDIPIIFIASNSAKDPEYNINNPNKSTLLVATWATIDQFSHLTNSSEKSKQRNYEYNHSKHIFSERLMKCLFTYFPNIKQEDIVYKNVSTPETFEYYLGRKNIYGLDSTTERYKTMRNIRPETNIKGFYISGHDLISLGFGGALTSGLVTTYSILGYNSILDIIKKRDLIREIQNIPK